MDFKLFLTPMCFVCKKQVEKIEWENDFCSQIIYAKVYCHKATEVAFLTLEMLRYGIIERGIAFMNKNIEDKAFDKQIEHQVEWIDKNPEAKGTLFGKEQDLFYRATDYRGS